MTAFDQPEAGEWVQPVRQGYKMACCDCGLVHNLDFRIHKGRVQFRAFRNNRSTAMMRRWSKAKAALDVERESESLSPDTGGSAASGSDLS